MCQNQDIFYMKRLNSNILSIGITLLLAIVVVVSSLVTSHIVEQFEQEEQKKIELWAEATRQFILAGENENIDLLLQVMEGNTTIPVYTRLQDNRMRPVKEAIPTKKMPMGQKVQRPIPMSAKSAAMSTKESLCRRIIFARFVSTVRRILNKYNLEFVKG